MKSAPLLASGAKVVQEASWYLIYPYLCGVSLISDIIIDFYSLFENLSVVPLFVVTRE